MKNKHGRLIDADALEREGWSLHRTFQKDECTMVYEVKKPSNFSTIEPEQKWIPVARKAHPDLPIRVQVQMDNGWIITAYYQEGEWLSVPDCGEALRDEWIEAWRELPEPYEERQGK